MKAKRAKIIVSAVDVICPDCQESLPSPGGSLFFEVSEYHEGQEQECSCGTMVRFPPLKVAR